MLDAGELFTRILRFLEIRPRSEHEVRLRLSRYGASDEQIFAVISKLYSLHFLDDQAFAHYVVDSRRLQGRSTRHIQSELSRQGIAKDIISQVLIGTDADRESLQKLIEKKSHLPREKLIAFLARRGFAWDLIKQALVEYNKDINRNS